MSLPLPQQKKQGREDEKGERGERDQGAGKKEREGKWGGEKK